MLGPAAGTATVPANGSGSTVGPGTEPPSTDSWAGVPRRPRGDAASSGWRAAVAGAATAAPATGRSPEDDTVNAAADSSAGDAVVPVAAPVADGAVPEPAPSKGARAAACGVAGADDSGDGVAAAPPAGAAAAGGDAEADAAADVGAEAPPEAGAATDTGAGCAAVGGVAGGAGTDEAAGAVVVTGAGDSGVDGRVTPRGGSSPSGSTYPSASDATRTPRWTLGAACSGSPLDPIVATAEPSSTVSPFWTSIDPRWTSVTAYPSAVRIVRLRP
ncbi:MAG TPA: hypothetical protein VNM44_14670 [Gaiella sp.]|nr:hypothetical protein [Gaiella sp.]HWO81689.1 hypothetical protein [Gaiella sp.]